MNKEETVLEGAKSKEAGANTELQRFLAFSLGDEEYAVPLLKVKEVIALPEVTPVPYTPTHFLGIMNLRGQVISIIDLRVKFKMQKMQRTQETAVIILDLSPLCIGVVVNSVNSVMAIEEKDISPKPDVDSKTDSDYIMGVARKDKKLVILLDIVKSLSVEDLMAVNKQSQPAQRAS